MDLYSLLLATAMGLVGLAHVLALIGRLIIHRPSSQSAVSAEKRRRAMQCLKGARWASLLTLVLIVLATVVHVVSGHQPGSEDAMGVVAFLVAHRALPIIFALALWSRWNARRAWAES